MDVKREGVAKKKLIRRIYLAYADCCRHCVASWRLSMLKPAAPSVERATVWIDTVKRGPMVRTCAAWGRWFPKISSGFRPSSTARLRRSWRDPAMK